jgi:hypothetical protein
MVNVCTNPRTDIVGPNLVRTDNDGGTDDADGRKRIRPLYVPGSRGLLLVQQHWFMATIRCVDHANLAQRVFPVESYVYQTDAMHGCVRRGRGVGLYRGEFV